MPGNKWISLLLLLCIGLPLLAQNQESKPLSGINVEGFQEKKEKEMVWKNNPFIQPVGPLDIQDLRLTAVVMAEGKGAEAEAVCLINGEAVRVGDKIGFSELLHIEKDHVVLRNENGIFSLSLKGETPPPASVPVEQAAPGEKQ